MYEYVDGSRTLAAFNAERCNTANCKCAKVLAAFNAERCNTANYKCAKFVKGCGADNNKCKGSLVCIKNKCQKT